MKNIRKVSVGVALMLAIVACLSIFTACGKKYVQQTDTAVYFTVDKAVMENVEGKKLIDYMNALVEKKQMTYEVKDGVYPMLIKVNDRLADESKGEFYFIYSDDAENTTEAYGKVEGEAIDKSLAGKTYYSTNYGINDQPLKEGATYIFMISTYKFDE